MLVIDLSQFKEGVEEPNKYDFLQLHVCHVLHESFNVVLLALVQCKLDP